MQSYVDGPYRSFTEETAGQLTSKEGYLVQLTSAKNTVQLLTTLPAIGVMHGKLQGANDVNIRLLGKGGTVKVVQGAAIAVGAKVMGASGGKVVTATAGNRAIGIKVGPAANGSDGDVIEIVDIVEPVVLPQDWVPGNADNEIGALTFSSTVVQAEAEALRDKCEELGDDIRALKTALDAAGITTTPA